MQVQGASPPASDDEEGPAAEGTGDETSDSAPAASHMLRSEHTQRWALAQQAPNSARFCDCHHEATAVQQWPQAHAWQLSEGLAIDRKRVMAHDLNGLLITLLGAGQRAGGGGPEGRGVCGCAPLRAPPRAWRRREGADIVTHTVRHSISARQLPINAEALVGSQWLPSRDLVHCTRG
jgi:hypothetical protein